MRATSRAAIGRPRPVPPYFRVVEVSSCSKARKILSCLSWGMPMPGVAHREAQADLSLGARGQRTEVRGQKSTGLFSDL
jgi:hypothetical protein